MDKNIDPKFTLKNQLKGLASQQFVDPRNVVKSPVNMSPMELFANLENKQPTQVPVEGTGLAQATSTVPTNNNAYLAEQLGLPVESINHLVRIESGGKGYDARNTKSSAFGRYQFMTGDSNSTGYDYAKRLGYKGKPGDELRSWMTPERQDRMFINLTRDNINTLERNDMEVSPYSIYGTHQQGGEGFRRIVRNKLTPQVEQNMIGNVPDKYKHLRGRALSDAWQSHWRKQMSGQVN